MAEEKVKVERDEDFEDLYANNVRFETSVWDIKILFGKLDLSQTPPEIVRLHTGMTIPWSAAKLLAYLMTVNIILHQSEHGEIKVPNQVLPPRPDPDNPELNAFPRETVVYLRWIHDQFFGSDPYVPPGASQVNAEAESTDKTHLSQP